MDNLGILHLLMFSESGTGPEARWLVPP